MQEQSIQQEMTNNVYFKLETTYFKSSQVVQLRQTSTYGFMLLELLLLFAKYILSFGLRKHLS